MLAAWRKATEPEVRVGDVAWCQVSRQERGWMERVEGGWLCWQVGDERVRNYRTDEVTVLRVLRQLPDGYIAVPAEHIDALRRSVSDDSHPHGYTGGAVFVGAAVERLLDALSDGER